MREQTQAWIFALTFSLLCFISHGAEEQTVDEPQRIQNFHWVYKGVGQEETLIHDEEFEKYRHETCLDALLGEGRIFGSQRFQENKFWETHERERWRRSEDTPWYTKPYIGLTHMLMWFNRHKHPVKIQEAATYASHWASPRFDPDATDDVTLRVKATVEGWIEEYESYGTDIEALWNQYYSSLSGQFALEEFQRQERAALEAGDPNKRFVVHYPRSTGKDENGNVTYDLDNFFPANTMSDVNIEKNTLRTTKNNTLPITNWINSIWRRNNSLPERGRRQMELWFYLNLVHDALLYYKSKTKSPDEYFRTNQLESIGQLIAHPNYRPQKTDHYSVSRLIFWAELYSLFSFVDPLLGSRVTKTILKQMESGEREHLGISTSRLAGTLKKTLTKRIYTAITTVGLTALIGWVNLDWLTSGFGYYSDGMQAVATSANFELSRAKYHLTNSPFLLDAHKHQDQPFSGVTAEFFRAKNRVLRTAKYNHTGNRERELSLLNAVIQYSLFADESDEIVEDFVKMKESEFINLFLSEAKFQWGLEKELNKEDFLETFMKTDHESLALTVIQIRYHTFVNLRKEYKDKNIRLNQTPNLYLVNASKSYCDMMRDQESKE